MSGWWRAALVALAMLSVGAGPARSYSVGDNVRAFHDRSNPSGIAVSPDGTRVAVSTLAGEDQLNVEWWFQRLRVAVHDLRDGRLLRHVGRGDGDVVVFAFSPDGRRLLTVRSCLDAAQCAAGYDRTRGQFFVETDLDTGGEAVVHRTELRVTSAAYDSRHPRRVIFAAGAPEANGWPVLLASAEWAEPGGSAASREAILLRWERRDGTIWRVLGGSADGRILFSGYQLAPIIPGLAEEARALPLGERLGTLRLLAWEAGGGDAAARVSVVPLRASRGINPRFALPLAATPDGRRVLLAATVPGRAILSFGAGDGSFGLSTELFLLEDGQLARLTRLCGIVRHAALSPDGVHAALMAGFAVTPDRTFTTMEVQGLRVDEASAAGGIVPRPSGILAARRSGGAALAAASPSEAACTETWPDPPAGRIAAGELLARISLLAARRTLADMDAIRASLRVQLEEGRSDTRSETLYAVIGDDIGHGAEGRRYPASQLTTRVFTDRGATQTWRELRIGVARTGPCVTLEDVMRVFGPGHRAEPPARGVISLLHHLHPRPVGEGRSEVDKVVYELGARDGNMTLTVLFGLERCAEAISLEEKG